MKPPRVFSSDGIRTSRSGFGVWTSNADTGSVAGDTTSAASTPARSGTVATAVRSAEIVVMGSRTLMSAPPRGLSLPTLATRLLQYAVPLTVGGVEIQGSVSMAAGD